MGLPEQERFTLEEVATRWGTSVPHVEEMVRTLKFKYIIVKGEIIGGSPHTRHLYFKQDLWTQYYLALPVVLPDDQKKLKDQKKQKKLMIKQIQPSLAKLPKVPAFTEAAQREIDRIQKGEHEARTYHNIGPTEVAHLWQPSPSSKQWERPKEAVVIYIPRVALEAFEKEHGLLEEENTKISKRKEKSSAPDLSEIDLKKWYPTRLAAQFLRVTQKHLQNNINNGLFVATKRGGRWEMQGRAIHNYLEKKNSES